MRSILALCATAWFVGAAVIMGDGSYGLSGDPPNQEVLGDPTVMAIYLAARILFIGLGIMSLSRVRGSDISHLLDRISGPGGGREARPSPLRDERVGR